MALVEIHANLTPEEERFMTKRFWMVLAVLATGTGVSGCAAALGAAGAVLVDQSMEQEQGGDGLF